MIKVIAIMFGLILFMFCVCVISLKYILDEVAYIDGMLTMILVTRKKDGEIGTEDEQ